MNKFFSKTNSQAVKSAAILCDFDPLNKLFESFLLVEFDRRKKLNRVVVEELIYRCELSSDRFDCFLSCKSTKECTDWIEDSTRGQGELLQEPNLSVVLCPLFSV